jgi:hypothetical protein
MRTKTMTTRRATFAAGTGELVREAAEYRAVGC